MPSLVTAARFAAAPDFSTYLTTVQKNAELWAGVYRLARVADEAVDRAKSLPGRWHLLALTEDWCGDAVNSLPVLARLAEQLPSMDLRFLGRDANPDLMDAHLSGHARSIPVVIVLDEEFEEVGWWGSRPRPLQEWFASAEVRAMDKDERYRGVRQWYARDRGRTFLDEILRIIEDATQRVTSR